MLISHSHKFIYTKTVKTASTSVEIFFERYCLTVQDELEYLKTLPSEFRNEYISASGIIGFRGTMDDREAKIPTWYNHMPASEIKRLIGEQLWNSYFKFFVIRNPYDKMISAFYFFNDVDRKIITLTRDNQIKLFRAWINAGKNLPIDRDKYTLERNYCMDFYIRFEYLIDDIQTICDRLKIKFNASNLHFYKSGITYQFAHREDYYDLKTAEIVESKFDFEFEHFNYKKLFSS